jgi:hypothetical protein
MLKIPHCLYNRLKDGGKVVSLTLCQRSAPQKHYFFLNSESKGVVLLEGSRKLRKLIYLVRKNLGTIYVRYCNAMPSSHFSSEVNLSARSTVSVREYSVYAINFVSSGWKIC